MKANTKQKVTSQNQIPFIHQWVRATRSPFEDDKFRVCWYFNHDTKDYIYEHKNAMFQCNGFSLSKGLCKKLPEELQKRYFDADERGFLFVVLGDDIMEYIHDDASVTEETFQGIFGQSKSAYFAQTSFDEWEDLI